VTPPLRIRHAIAVVAALACLTAAATAEPLAVSSWRRTPEQAVAPGECQQLAVSQAGSGFLELRLVPYPLPPLGSEPKIAGASVFIPATGDRATIVLYHTTGPYALTLSVDGPLRWSIDGTSICFADSSRPLACGHTHDVIRFSQRIAFGAGWQTEIVSCAPFITPHVLRPHVWVLLPLAGIFAALLAFQLRRRPRLGDWIGIAAITALAACAALAWVDPWWIGPGWLLVSAMLALLWVLIRLARSRGRGQSAFVALAATAAAAMLLAPHPLLPLPDVRTRDEPAVPPLWTDAAYWHFHSPQQELGFRDRPIGELPTSAGAIDDELWLVIGGSVTYGSETDPQTTFTALAEQQLRRDGQPVRLLNGGVGGWNLSHIDRVLRDIGDRLPLRGIVIVSILNNATFRIVGPPHPPTCTTLLCAYAYNLSRNYLLAPVVNVLLPAPGNEARFATLLDDIITRELARGREVILLDETHDAQLRPAWYNSWVGGPQERYRSTTRRIGAAHGLELHRVDDAVAALPPDERFSDGMHLTPAAHAAVAARLAAIVEAERATRTR
jgi:lysophospholipase L1-like esterase